jgi:hypothetical protein
MGKAERLTAGAAAYGAAVGGTAVICEAIAGKPGRAGRTAGVIKASGAI